MGAINPPSPLLFGPNNTATNLENGMFNADGSYNKNDGVYNYIQTGRFDNGITSATLFNTTLTSGLPTGTVSAGATSLAASQQATGALIGTSSLQILAATTWTAGQGFYMPTFTVRPADLGKVLTFSFTYQATAGSSALNWSGVLGSQSLMVYIYDVTASSWVQPTGFLGLNTGVGTQLVSGQFQSSTTSGQQYRLFVMASQVSSATCTVLFDNFVVSPQTIPIGYAGTDWFAYAPTFVGLGTVTTINMESRRVGDSLELRGSWINGTVTGSTVTMSLGYQGANANVTIDPAKVPTIQIAGYGVRSPASVAPVVVLATGSTGVFNFSLSNNAVFPLVAQAGTSIFGNTETVSISALVPIAGWSSNVQMSADSVTQVIASSAKLVGSYAVGANAIIKWDAAVSDKSGLYSTGTGNFTAPIGGTYILATTVLTSAASSLFAVVNGSAKGYLLTCGGSLIAGGSIELQLNAGDVVGVWSDSAVTITAAGTYGSYGNVSLTRMSGPAVIAVSESVNARYYSSSSAVSSSLATVMYATKGWDTHAAYNAATGIYTAPITGKYQVNCSVACSATFVLNSTLDIQMQQAGSATQISETTQYAFASATALTTTIGDIFYLLAGDTLKVQVSCSGTTPTIVSSTSKNWFSIARVGN